MKRFLAANLAGLSIFAGLLLTPLAAGAEDLSFARAVQLAEKHSEILMIQTSAVRTAGLVLAEARSRLGPELTFEGGGSYMAHPPLTITVQPGALYESPTIPDAPIVFPEDKASGYFELSLKLSQPLFTWGKLRSSVQLAGLGLERSRAELAERKRQVQQDLHAAYFAGVLARDSLDLLQQILDILGEIEEDRKRAFELGSVNRLSVLEIESQISEGRRWIVQAEQAYATSMQAIAMYTDLEPEFRKDPLRLSEVELKESALRSSPALEKARLDQQRARANLKIIRGGANLRPDLSFNLSFEVSGLTIPWSETEWQDTWDLNLIAGVGTGGSLFDSGRSRYKLRQAEEAMTASQLAVDLLSKQIRLQTRRAIETLRLRWAELEEARAAVARAEEERKNADRAYEQQLLTRQQWGMARFGLLQQRLALLQREHSYELALYELESLAGLQ
jgi:outer membrane protein TolC